MKSPNCLAPGRQHEDAPGISFCLECYNASPASYTPTLAEACEVIRGLLDTIQVLQSDGYLDASDEESMASARDFLKRVEGE